ncbi:MAG: hypothetical protein M3Z05_17330 [Gemmatimonadota bacterium]|nr:hypothetical protein [Gemmatimonadota bacterium]
MGRESPARGRSGYVSRGPLHSDDAYGVPKVQVSLDGGTGPVWGPDGREIFYRTLSDSEPRLTLAVVHAAPLSVARRSSLFPLGDVVSSNPHANYDVAPDGKTFVMVRRGHEGDR